jgi:hypothetical protein
MTNGHAPDVYKMQELPTDVGELRAALQEKTLHMKQLEHRLAHLQAWMEAQASQMQASNPATVKNARRLYIGGLPEGTTDVSRQRPGSGRTRQQQQRRQQQQQQAAAMGCLYIVNIICLGRCSSQRVVVSAQLLDQPTESSKQTGLPRSCPAGSTVVQQQANCLAAAPPGHGSPSPASILMCSSATGFLHTCKHTAHLQGACAGGHGSLWVTQQLCRRFACTNSQQLCRRFACTNSQQLCRRFACTNSSWRRGRGGYWWLHNQQCYRHSTGAAAGTISGGGAPSCAADGATRPLLVPVHAAHHGTVAAHVGRGCCCS